MAATTKIKAMRKVAIFLFAISLFNCSEEIEPGLEPHVDAFFAEAKKRGIDIKRPRNLRVVFKDLSKAQGRCFPVLNTVQIDPNSGGWKYNPEAVVFHELGHLILHRAHRNERAGKFCLSIMSNTDDPVYDEGRLSDRRQYYVDELFLGPVGVPEWCH